MGVGSAGWVSWPGVWILFNVARTVWRGLCVVARAAGCASMSPFCLFASTDPQGAFHIHWVRSLGWRALCCFRIHGTS